MTLRLSAVVRAFSGRGVKQIEKLRGLTEISWMAAEKQGPKVSIKNYHEILNGITLQLPMKG